MKAEDYDAVIVGGGIVGLAHALESAMRGLKTAVIERDSFAAGASIRNFGLAWIIGQAEGTDLERAMIGREMWLSLSNLAGFSCRHIGSIHTAFHKEEFDVIEEFASSANDKGYDCQLLNVEKVVEKLPCINPIHLKGGLYSATELSIDAVKAIPALSKYIANLGVDFYFNESGQWFDGKQLQTNRHQFNAERFIFCTGSDFEQFFPNLYPPDLVRCKLQMMQTVPQPTSFKMNTVYASGLSLRHYASFSFCKSITALQQLADERYQEFGALGIHVLAVANEMNQITIGDSHFYSNEPQPFDDPNINELILNYSKQHVNIPHPLVSKYWSGTYLKYKSGSVFKATPQDNVRIVNGLGGGGITLSFAIAQEVFNQW